MAQHRRSRLEDRLSAVTAAVMVAGTGLGLAVVAALAQPIDVTMNTGRGTRGGPEMGFCATRFHQVGLGLSRVTNHGDSPVDIISVRPDSSGSKIRVLGHVVGKDIIFGGGDKALPRLPHPHTIPAHSTVGLEALVAGEAGGRTAGFDIVLRNGQAEATDHLLVGVSFPAEPCPGT